MMLDESMIRPSLDDDPRYVVVEVRINPDTLAWIENFRADRQTLDQAMRYLLTVARQTIEARRVN